MTSPRALTGLSGCAEPAVALVPGSSRSIGLEFVRQLTRKPNVERVLSSYREPGTAEPLRARMADPETAGRRSVEPPDGPDEASMAAAVAAQAGRVDPLRNRAGTLHAPGLRPERRLADVGPRPMLRSFEVHALGPLLVAKHFGRLLPTQARCVVASESARVGSIGDNRLGGWYAYRTAKAAQNMIARNLSIGLCHRALGLICVRLHPGTVDTDRSRPFLDGVPEGHRFAVERAAGALLAAVQALNRDDTGQVFAGAGRRVPC